MVNPTLPQVCDNRNGSSYSLLVGIEQSSPTIAGKSAREEGDMSFQISTTSSVEKTTWTSRSDSPDTTITGTQASIHAGIDAGIVSWIPRWPRQTSNKTCRRCKQGEVRCIPREGTSCKRCRRLGAHCEMKKAPRVPAMFPDKESSDTEEEK